MRRLEHHMSCSEELLHVHFNLDVDSLASEARKVRFAVGARGPTVLVGAGVVSAAAEVQPTRDRA